METLQKVVVTGVSSFIGFHLARFLARDHYRILGIISQSAGSYQDLRLRRLHGAVDAGAELRELDITDETALCDFIEAECPDVWIHHAGWAENYSSSEYDLDKGYAINVKPLRSLYAALSQTNCRGVIITGSCFEYSNSDTACSENDVCFPATPYGLSKLTETLRARQLAHQYGLPTRVARVFIPFGSGDSPNKLLSSVATALRAGRSIDLSTCDQKRDFIYINDLAAGYKALIKDLERNELFDLFNLCGGEATQVKQLLLQIASLLDADPNLLLFGRRPKHPEEAEIWYGSNDKAYSLLGWKPGSLPERLKSYLKEKGDGTWKI